VTLGFDDLKICERQFQRLHFVDALNCKKSPREIGMLNLGGPFSYLPIRDLIKLIDQHEVPQNSVLEPAVVE